MRKIILRRSLLPAWSATKTKRSAETDYKEGIRTDQIDGVAEPLAFEQSGQTIARNNMRQAFGDESNTIRKIDADTDPSDGMRAPLNAQDMSTISATSSDSMPMVQRQRNKPPRVRLVDPSTMPQRPFERTT